MIDASRPKTFVIDTNVLLHNPQSLYVFADNHVVIPMTVLEELDKFKTSHNELGQSAREVARSLDRLRKKGSLKAGVPTPQGGSVQVVIEYDEVTGMLPQVNDNRIIGCAHLLKREGKRVIFVSKDINARVKADALGIETEDFENQKVNIDQLYAGWTSVTVDEHRFDELIKVDHILPAELDPELERRLSLNEFVVVRDGSHEDAKHDYELFRFDGEKLIHIDDDPPRLYGIVPRSPEQRIAFDLLLDPNVRLVTMVGQAGTGKTLLALACGLTEVVHGDRFKKLLVSRPIMPLGQDIGYLPGSKDDKLSHWMGPIFDNLHFLLASEERDPDDVIKKLIAEQSVSLEALTYIRGRSISKQFVIVDEAQNLTPHEIKTIISRAGADTKVVLTGDPNQIDNPYLDASSNGLTYVVERMRGQPLAGHVTLTKSERSELAGIAASLL
jgi:PhoH-like ATPase